MTPVMYIDPKGESLVGLVLIALLTTSLALVAASTSPSDNSADTISAYYSFSSAPNGLGFNVAGFGYEVYGGKVGQSCTLSGFCSDYVEWGGTVVGISYSNQDIVGNGNFHTVSIGPVFITVDKKLRVDSFGLDWGASLQTPSGGVSEGVVIDIYGIMKGYIGGNND